MLACSFPGILWILGIGPILGANQQQPTPRIEVRAGGGGVSAQTVRVVSEAADAAWYRLQGDLQVEDPLPMRITVHRSLADLPESLGVRVPEGTPGFAMLLGGQIHLMLRESGAVPPDDVRTVLAHEIVHLLVQQAASPHGGQVPRWFHEGLAQTLAGGTYYGAKEEHIYPALRGGSLPSLISWVHRMPGTTTGRRDAYAACHSFVRWIWSRIGAAGVRDILARVRSGEPWSAAFVAVTGSAAVTLEMRWRDHALKSSLYRFLEANCFSLLLLLALPLLILAVRRRLDREANMRARLEREHTVEPLPPSPDIPNPEPRHPHSQPPDHT